MKKITFLCLCGLVLAGCGSSDPWKQADKIVSSMTKVSIPEREVTITDLGAVPGDSLNPCHDVINLAIINMSLQGGGVVKVPAGVFYTGPITLKSNVALELEEGAVLRFSTDESLYYPPVPTRWEGIDCYNTHPLLYAWGETNIAIRGKGTIDGQADRNHWWPRQREVERNGVASRLQLLEMGESGLPLHQRVFSPDVALRPQTLNFNHCKTVLIEGVTFLNSPFWVLHPLMCEDLTVRGVTINNDGPNGDGCDPESCRNVLIEGCTFNTGDDCIAIKSGRNEDGRKWNRPSENIVVRDCYMANGHGGVVIGSEISGGFRNLYVENCKMDSPQLDRVVRIKTSTASGGVIENVYVRNVEVEECREAVLRINLRYEPGEKARRGFIPTVRNVNLENVHCLKSQYGIRLDGLEEQKNIYDISVKNCVFEGVQDGNLVSGKVGKVELDGTTINGQKATL